MPLHKMVNYLIFSSFIFIVKPKAANHILREREVNELLDLCETDDERFAFAMTVFTGMRVSEFVHMRCSWVDIDDRLIFVPRSQPCSCAECMRKRGGVWRAKTDAAARPIPIIPEIEDILYDYFAGNDTVMENYPYRQRAWLLIKRVAERGMTKTFPHALRATFATILAGKLPDALAVKDIMGWTTIGMAQHYIKLSGKSVRRKVDAAWKKETER